MPKTTSKMFRDGQELTDTFFTVRRNVKLFGDYPASVSREIRRLYINDLVPIGRDETGARVIADRIIYYKTNPSLHRCDARCQNAKGHSCECSCGGTNHGISA